MFNYFFSEYKRRYRIKGTKKLFKDIIKKSNIETPQEYKLRAINNLIDLCKDPVFNLYTSEGIDWLLKMCDNEIKENIKRNSLDKSALLALWSTISSVIGFIAGTVADNVDISVKINLTTLVIGVIICISVLFAIIAASLLLLHSLTPTGSQARHLPRRRLCRIYVYLNKSALPELSGRALFHDCLIS